MITEKFSFEFSENQTGTYTRPRPNFTETAFSFPPELSKGSVRFIQLQDELGINIVNQWTLDEKVTDRPDGPAGLLQFAFYISGEEVTAETADIENKVSVHDGDSIILPPIVGARLQIPPHRHFYVVLVLIKPELLFEFIEKDATRLHPGFIKYLEGAARRPFIHQGRITPAIRVVLQQVLCCPYRGALKHLYLEAKALELVSLRLEQLLRKEQPAGPLFPLRRADRERIREAERILTENMDNPPTLNGLAGKVAVNVNKLKYGFRALYGTSVFSYLREQRLNLARFLLEQGRLNVSEVAYRVGYHDLSYFAESFRSRFGVNPSTLLKQHRQ
jgi:AraC-like DNA-binding protein